jgi:dTDP-4-amino-4,6-dideoxygalactose transaminase
VLGDLAIAGGSPQFDAPQHVGRPNIGERARFLARVEAMLDRRWLSNDGPLVQELEQVVAELHGVRGAVAMANATLGLQLVARALGVRGDVLVPAFTFVATAHAMTWEGASPHFVDIRPEDHNVDPRAVAEAITDRTGAIAGVHLWGQPCDVPALEALATAHDVPLILDAAHAVGAGTRHGAIGGGGAAEVLSLHATKFVNAGEGGVVLSDDLALLTELRALRNFGFADYDLVTSLGTNAKMPELCAAMGLTSLESLDAFTDANRTNHERYVAALEPVGGLRVLRYDPVGRSNFQYVVVEIDEEALGIARDDVVDALHAEHVLARRYFYPGCHRHAPYSGWERRWDLPVTERVAASVIVLPTGTAVTPDDCTTIGGLVAELVAPGSPLTRRRRDRR